MVAGTGVMSAARLLQVAAGPPWLLPLQGLLASLAASLAQPGFRDDLLPSFNQLASEQGLQNRDGVPLAFVPQSCLPAGVAYESFIFDNGQVPSRDNLHDFFNALIWLRFPAIKRQLNAMQAACIREAGVGQVRGKLRDAVTLFDESAAIVAVRASAAGSAMSSALRGHDWHTLLVAQRAAFGQDMAVFLFGHALLEKLCQPYKAITAHAWLVSMDEAFFSVPLEAQCALIDAAVAAQLKAGELSHTRCFTPLPVLGVPHWWPQQDDAFYADTAVFRPRRKLA